MLKTKKRTLFKRRKTMKTNRRRKSVRNRNIIRNRNRKSIRNKNRKMMGGGEGDEDEKVGSSVEVVEDEKVAASAADNKGVESNECSICLSTEAELADLRRPLLKMQHVLDENYSAEAEAALQQNSPHYICNRCFDNMKRRGKDFCPLCKRKVETVINENPIKEPVNIKELMIDHLEQMPPPPRKSWVPSAWQRYVNEYGSDFHQRFYDQLSRQFGEPQLRDMFNHVMDYRTFMTLSSGEQRPTQIIFENLTDNFQKFCIHTQHKPKPVGCNKIINNRKTSFLAYILVIEVIMGQNVVNQAGEVKPNYFERTEVGYFKRIEDLFGWVNVYE